MLTTFLIGLREGLEAALIVGIVAAYLNQRGRRDLLSSVWLGVAAAALLCLAISLALERFSSGLSQRQQENLETVIGVVAVAMVSYMVIWMRRHSRDLKHQLVQAADSAMHSGSARAFVVMAFLAVFREGLETSAFLLAAFNAKVDPVDATIGLVLGLGCAALLGYGIYRGGVHINLSKFFRFTGAGFVLVAAGLLVNALHTAHEAGWLNIGQTPVVNLSWLLRPGTVHATLLTGMLGWQEHPVVIETTAWLVYLIPIGLYVCWPPGTSITAHTVKRTAFTVSVAAALAALPLALWPASPEQHSPTTASFTEAGPTRAVATIDAHPMSSEVLRVHTSGAGLPQQDWTATRADRIRLDGVPATRYRATIVHAETQTAVTLQRLATFYGGRLPLGITANNTIQPVQLTTQTTDTITVDTDPVGGPLNFTYTRSIDQTAQLTRGDTSLPVRRTAVRSSPVSQHQLLVTARRAQAAGRHAKTRHALATTFSALCLASLAVAGSLTINDARRRRRSRIL